MKDLIKVLGTLTLIVIAFIYGPLVTGLVIDRIYYWFLLPLVPSLPLLTYKTFVGIWFVLQLFKNGSNTVVLEEYRDKQQEMVMALISPWILLFIAWIFHLILS